MGLPPRLLLAALAPFVVAGAGYLALAGPTPTEPSAAVSELDKRARAAHPDVVLLGASFAAADFDAAAFGKRLGRGGKPAFVVGMPAATAPVWYAMLKERVYANGATPSLVVLPVGTPSMLVTRLLPAQVERLNEQMPVYDEVVMRRSFGSEVPLALQRVIDRRASLRDPILAGFRDALPRLILGADDAAVSAAGTTVFGEQHAAAGARLLPVVEQGSEVRDAASVSVTDPAESYLQDIYDLVTRHGGRLAIVIPPVAPTSTVQRRAEPAAEAALVAWANERGVGWLDLRDLGWPSTRFKDGVHMRPEDAKEFSALVATRLAELGALGGDGFRPATAPILASEVRRIGTAPPLPVPVEHTTKDPCQVNVDLPGLEFLGTRATASVAAGIRSPLVVHEGETELQQGPNTPGCSGTWRHLAGLVVRRTAAGGASLRVTWLDTVPDRPGQESAAWIYPGTALEWRFDAPSAPGATLVAEALSFGPGAGRPELVVGEQSSAFTQAGARLHAEAALPGSGSWSLQLRSPADGPYLLVRALRIVNDGRTTPLIDEPVSRELDVLDKGGWTVDGAPPPTPPLPLEEKGDRRWFTVPRVGPCSPFRVREGATPIAQDTTPATGQSPPAAETTVQAGDRLYLPTSRVSAPAEAFALELSPDRHCAASRPKGGDGLVWVYGGDTLHLDVPRGKLHALGGDAQRVRVSGTPLPGDVATATLHVRVSLAGVVLAEADLPAAEVRGGHVLALSAPVAATAPGALTVDATWSPSAPPLLLRLQIADSGA